MTVPTSMHEAQQQRVSRPPIRIRASSTCTAPKAAASSQRPGAVHLGGDDEGGEEEEGRGAAARLSGGGGLEARLECAGVGQEHTARVVAVCPEGRRCASVVLRSVMILRPQESIPIRTLRAGTNQAAAWLPGRRVRPGRGGAVAHSPQGNAAGRYFGILPGGRDTRPPAGQSARGLKETRPPPPLSLLLPLPVSLLYTHSPLSLPFSLPCPLLKPSLLPARARTAPRTATAA